MQQDADRSHNRFTLPQYGAGDNDNFKSSNFQILTTSQKPKHTHILQLLSEETCKLKIDKIKIDDSSSTVSSELQQ